MMSAPRWMWTGLLLLIAAAHDVLSDKLRKIAAAGPN